MPPAKAVLPPIRTAAIAVVGGVIGGAIGMPSAWLTGPMFAAAIASLFGVPTGVPSWAWVLSTAIIGIALGTSITPDAVHQMGSWPLTLLMVVVGSALVQIVSQYYFERVCGWDRGSAFFGSIPGAFSLAVSLSAESKADLRLVVIAQSMRIFVLVLVLPVIIVLMEGAGMAGGALFWRLRVPAGALLGAMAASGVLHGAGLSDAAP
jgi:uncharacterized protein